MMKKGNLKMLVFLLALSSFFVACESNNTEAIEIGGSENEMEEAPLEIVVSQAQFAMAKMKTGTLKAHAFPTTVRAAGTIEIPAKNQIQVSSYAGGYVTQINLVPGQLVRQGQVLFVLENPEFVQMQQDYLEAKEQLAYLQSDYERQKTLASEKVASQKNYLKAESDYRVTLAKMEGMKKRLSLLKISVDQISPQNLQTTISILAPASGYVTEVFAMKGMFLNPTDVAVALLNTDDIHLELSVFEKDILNIKVGQEISFRIPDASPEVFKAEVHLIGKMVDPEKRVVRVHGHLKNPKDKMKLIGGMYADAEITTEDHSTSGLPESAIVIEDGVEYVLIQQMEKGDSLFFTKEAVQTGQRKNGFVQIVNSDDFSGEEKILIEGAFNLIGIE